MEKSNNNGCSAQASHTVVNLKSVPADSACRVDQQRSFSDSCNIISQIELLGQNHFGHPDTSSSSAMTVNLHAQTHDGHGWFGHMWEPEIIVFTKDFSKGREGSFTTTFQPLNNDQPIQLIDFRHMLTTACGAMEMPKMCFYKNAFINRVL